MFLIGRTMMGRLEEFWISKRLKVLCPKHALCALYLVVKYVNTAAEDTQFFVHLCCAGNHHPQAQSVSTSRNNSASSEKGCCSTVVCSYLDKNRVIKV